MKGKLSFFFFLLFFVCVSFAETFKEINIDDILFTENSCKSFYLTGDKSQYLLLHLKAKFLPTWGDYAYLKIKINGKTIHNRIDRTEKFKGYMFPYSIIIPPSENNGRNKVEICANLSNTTKKIKILGTSEFFFTSLAYFKGCIKKNVVGDVILGVPSFVKIEITNCGNENAKIEFFNCYNPKNHSKVVAGTTKGIVVLGPLEKHVYGYFILPTEKKRFLLPPVCVRYEKNGIMIEERDSELLLDPKVKKNISISFYKKDEEGRKELFFVIENKGSMEDDVELFLEGKNLKLENNYIKTRLKPNERKTFSFSAEVKKKGMLATVSVSYRGIKKTFVVEKELEGQKNSTVFLVLLTLVALLVYLWIVGK